MDGGPPPRGGGRDRSSGRSTSAHPGSYPRAVEHRRRTGHGLLVPAGVLLAQLAWWPLGPGLSGTAVDRVRLIQVALVTAVAVAALGYRHRAPELALTATLAAAVPGAGMLPDALVCPVAVAVALYALVLRRTARESAAWAFATVGAGGVIAVLRGDGPRAATGDMVFFAAGAAVVWAFGRRSRRLDAERRAIEAYRTAAEGLEVAAVATERHRLAVELHDVAAHRLSGIVVSGAAAQRLADPGLRAAAVAHAAAAGALALEELDRLVATHDTTTLFTQVDIDTLVAEHPGVGYQRSAVPLPPSAADLAYRVVREALTNTIRYAAGAAVTVDIHAADGNLQVLVADRGGRPALAGIGGGRGLAGLQDRVTAAGGRLHAGPAEAGWRVDARFPLPEPVPPATGPAGPAIADQALVVLAAGISFGIVLLPGSGDTDMLAAPLPGTLLLLALGAHALPLAWRRRRPGAALLAALAVLAALTGGAAGGWFGFEPAELLLWCWWVELVLVYAAAVRSARGWWAPVPVALLGGAALASGPAIGGNRIGVAAVLAVMLAAPAYGVCWAGRLTARRRRGRRSRDLRQRDTDRERAELAAQAERARFARGLSDSARRHTAAVVAAAVNGRLDVVVREGRAGLVALREMLGDVPVDRPDPPPGLAALAPLAARRGADLRTAGPARPVRTAVEVTAFRLVDALLEPDGRVLVAFGPDGVHVEIGTATGRGAPNQTALRAVHRIVDAADGTVLRSTEPDTVRVWLPEPPR